MRFCLRERPDDVALPSDKRTSQSISAPFSNDDVGLEHGQTLMGDTACCYANADGVVDCKSCLDTAYTAWMDSLGMEERVVAARLLDRLKETASEGTTLDQLPVSLRCSRRPRTLIRLSTGTERVRQGTYHQHCARAAKASNALSSLSWLCLTSLGISISCWAVDGANLCGRLRHEDLPSQMEGYSRRSDRGDLGSWLPSRRRDVVRATRHDIGKLYDNMLRLWN